MNPGIDPNFRQRVEALVAQIPRGRVMTYGQLAALGGNARAARIVGGIAHFGDPNLPWQRVVNKSGGLAAGYPGGRRGHAEHLQAEGVAVDENDRVDVHELLWWPRNGQGSFSVDTREPSPKIKPNQDDNKTGTKPAQQELL
jgi:methylated-DNA-protein-cysteine methyltransferase-like protein